MYIPSELGYGDSGTGVLLSCLTLPGGGLFLDGLKTDSWYLLHDVGVVQV